MSQTHIFVVERSMFPVISLAAGAAVPGDSFAAPCAAGHPRKSATALCAFPSAQEVGLQARCIFQGAINLQLYPLSLFVFESGLSLGSRV